MIRKPTLILLVVFAVLLGAAFYLQNNPIKPATTQTPSPTQQPALLGDYSLKDIVQINFTDPLGPSYNFQRETVKGWQETSGKITFDPIEIDNFIFLLGASQVQTQLDTAVAPDRLGLTKPNTLKVSLENANGKKLTLLIGEKTTSDTGYYVKVDDRPAAIVNKVQIDGIVAAFQQLRATPTPIATTPAATGSTTPTPGK